MFILEDGVGCVEMQFDNKMPNVAYVRGLMVAERERRKGYGTELLNICHGYARDHRKQFMQLSVEIENKWLVEWYKRFGFVILNEEDHEYLMIKNL